MTGRTRVKICGITRLDDALAAVQAGADALGFVFVGQSPRAISVADARQIAFRLPAFVMPVGLFLDAPEADVHQAIDDWPELVPQFHGRESPADCERFGRRYLKALGLGTDPGTNPGTGGQDVPDEASLCAYSGAAGFLYDSHAPGGLGGTGVAFDWNALAGRVTGDRPLILAGGLDPGNVAAAIGQLRPWAVDVSSGVESARGIKDHEAIRAFIAAVRAADRALADTAASPH